MSLISEEERARLENFSCSELKEKGFKSVNSLKPALREEIFYILAENSPLEAMKKLKEKGMNYSFSTIRGYRGALTSNNLVRKCNKKAEEKNKKFLEFLRKNPSATIKDVINAGYESILSSYYKGAINRAKQEAGIPSEYYNFYPNKQRTYSLKDTIYGLILSSTKPLYVDEITAILKCSHTQASRVLLELKREGKIEYRKILESFGGRGAKKFKVHDLLGGSWRKFGAKKIVFDINNPHHLEFIAREISSEIKRCLGGNLSLGVRKALTYRLKSLPENLKNLIKEHLYSV